MIQAAHVSLQALIAEWKIQNSWLYVTQHRKRYSSGGNSNMLYIQF